MGTVQRDSNQVTGCKCVCSWVSHETATFLNTTSARKYKTAEPAAYFPRLPSFFRTTSSEYRTPCDTRRHDPIYKKPRMPYMLCLLQVRSCDGTT